MKLGLLQGALLGLEDNNCKHKGKMWIKESCRVVFFPFGAFLPLRVFCHLASSVRFQWV